MGAGSSKLAFAGRPPTVILLAGLQGSGKTTAAAKLALLLRKEGKTPALVACDLQRPGGDRPARAARQADPDPGLRERGATDAVAVARRRASSRRRRRAATSSSSTRPAACTIDEALMDELARVRKADEADNVLLVLDAMTGQEAVAVAEASRSGSRSTAWCSRSSTATRAAARRSRSRRSPASRSSSSRPARSSTSSSTSIPTAWPRGSSGWATS